ncbi:MAG: sugar transferase [Paracoccaceae bacterium]
MSPSFQPSARPARAAIEAQSGTQPVVAANARQQPQRSRFYSAQMSGNARAVLLAAADLSAMAIVSLLTAPAIATAGLMSGSIVAAMLGFALAALAGLYRAKISEPDELRQITGVATVLALLEISMASAPTTMSVSIYWLGTIAALIGLRTGLRALPITADLMHSSIGLAGSGDEWEHVDCEWHANRAGHLECRRAPARLSPVVRSAWDVGLKRFLDVALSLFALILLAPLFGLIMAGLARERGTLFFRQTRVGQHGRRFTCLKFRTMREDAQDRLELLLDCNPTARTEWAQHQKLFHDPRVTWLGQILRSSSLDELPQLINILRGDMSLVGPRPIIAPEVPGYPSDQRYFHGTAFSDYASCLPGLTGLWQVSGRHQTPYAERVRLDQCYARQWSMWLDFVILLRTIKVVLRRDGR